MAINFLFTYFQYQLIISNNNFNYGYHELLNNWQNSGVYGGGNQRVLGFSNNHIYYSSDKYIDGKY